MFVVDASVTLAWCFEDETSAAAEAALAAFADEEAIAPAIWPFEVANAIRTAERRGRLELSDVARVRSLLLALPIEIEATDLGAALGEVAEVARTLDLSAYDAAYLSLAARRGIPVATVDDRLRRAAVAAGVPLVG